MISHVFTSHWSECVTLVAEPENINQKQIIIRNNLLNFQSLFLHIFDNNFQKFEIISHDRTPPLTGHKGSSSLYRNLSMPASTPKPSVRIQDPGAGGQSRPGLAARSGSGAKEMILMWVQARIKDYPVRITHIMMMTTHLIFQIPMTNFSTCWNDGLAFCALIHVFYPDNFDWFSLKKENRRHNFTLAFEKAE